MEGLFAKVVASRPIFVLNNRRFYYRTILTWRWSRNAVIRKRSHLLFFAGPKIWKRFSMIILT